MNIEKVKYSIDRIVFFDIETTTITKDYFELSDIQKDMFCKKANLQYRNEIPENGDCSTMYVKKASLLSEFSKIVCISIGYYEDNSENSEFIVKTIKGTEIEILDKFKKFYLKNFEKDNVFSYFCGHNILNFDIPYILRKFLQHRISIPYGLNTVGKKPWEIEIYLDTKEILSFGSYLYKTTTLQEYAMFFNIYTYKDTLGEDVFYKYWIDDDVDSIYKHCESDVLATAELFKNTITLF